MKIIITDRYIEELKDKYDYFFLFNNRIRHSSEKLFSILNILESEKIFSKNELNTHVNNYINKFLKLNSKIFKNKYYKILLESIFFEKNIFISNFYFNFYQYIVFKKIFTKFEKKNNKIYIDLNCNILNSFFDNNRVKTIFKYSLNIIICYIKGIKFYLFNNFSFKIPINKKKFKKKKLLFVDHYANFSSINKNSKIWNNLNLHYNISEFDNLAVNAFKKNTSFSKQNFYILQKYNNLFISLKTFYFYTKFYLSIMFSIKNKKYFNKETLYLFNFLKFSHSGSSLIKTINDYFLFNYFFSINSYEKIFITHENQPWEHICTNSIKSFNKKSLVYYYIHTPLRYWDIRYDPDIYNKINLNSLPDYICFSSKNCYIQYSDICSGILLKLVDALRYKHLIELKKSKTDIHKIKRNSFVLIGDIVKESTFGLLTILDLYAKDIRKKINIYVKFHNSNVIETYQFNNISIYDVDKLKKNMTYIYLFPNYTTASIDYFYQDKICISFLDKFNFNLSPLLKKPNYNFFFDDLDSFKTILNKLDIYNINRNKHNFIFEKKLKNWRKLI